MFHVTEQEERSYLQYVQQELDKSLQEIDAQIEMYHQKILETKRYMYENQAELDLAEKALNRVTVFNDVSFGEDAVKQKERISRLIQSPYFGRIDFHFQSESKEKTFYIGIYGFSKSGSSDNLIYDWRAPVSGIFYDFEIGPAFYMAPMGKIEGNLCLKRQYKIKHGQMDYMIETSLNIIDELLQRELSHNADKKMKNIVATIQREQNTIIRNDAAKVLIIQGAAGSGKTSIALHRIAFLLYRQKGILNSQNIMIVSPNKVFADYISNVLPELGEENMQEMNFDDLAGEYLEKKYKYQNFAQQVENIISSDDNTEMIARIEFKATNQFVERLQDFLKYAEGHYFVPSELLFGDFYVSKEDLLTVYQRLNNFPIKFRLRKIADNLIAKYEAKKGKRLENPTARKVRDAIQKMFEVQDSFSLYSKFYEYIGLPEYLYQTKKNVLEYCDLYPFIYTKIFLEGIITDYSRIKHLLIDEMQDYTPIQYAVLAKLFSCKMTILGDAFQSVNPYSSSSMEKIQPYFMDCQTVELCKSYRCTFEISEFAKRIINNQKLISIERHGKNPTVTGFDDAEREVYAIQRYIMEFKKSQYSSLGIICKSQKEADCLFKKLCIRFDDLTLLDFESTNFCQGIIITSVHMAKGLEFDQVIIPYVSNENYHTKLERNLLYISCTRAMHKLDLTYHGDRSEFLAENSFYHPHTA